MRIKINDQTVNNYGFDKVLPSAKEFLAVFNVQSSSSLLYPCEETKFIVMIFKCYSHARFQDYLTVIQIKEKYLTIIQIKVKTAYNINISCNKQK